VVDADGNKIIYPGIFKLSVGEESLTIILQGEKSMLKKYHKNSFL
jgi:hypothetical protein